MNSLFNYTCTSDIDTVAFLGMNDLESPENLRKMKRASFLPFKNLAVCGIEGFEQVITFNKKKSRPLLDHLTCHNKLQ